MTTKKISSEKAWGLIKDALSKYYIAVPTDCSTVYTEISDIPKDIKGVILFREYYNMFLIEFKDNGEIEMTGGDYRDAKGLMKAFYDLRYEVVTGEYTSPNGDPTSYHEHVYIDLGLPSGLKWAKTDVGRYAWAETIGKESFSKSNARKRTKFSDVKGDAKMDAARVHWGGKWRTPTPEEFQELIDCCSWQWRGWGYLLTGPNGKQLYLPACGYNESAWGPLGAKSKGYYWTTESKEGEDNATCLIFDKKERKLEWKESYMGMCVRPVFSESEAEPEAGEDEKPAINPEDYNRGIVRENGTFKEKYIFSGDKNWKTGNRATAQRKIKTGDTVELKFLGAGEKEISVKEWNGVWEMHETIDVMGENFYFEVVVNEKQAYYGKHADYRYTKASDTMGGGVHLQVTRTSISETDVLNAFRKFKDWLSGGAKDNNYWHGLYKKTEFPEKIAYGMPGEEVSAPVEEASWNVGDVIEEGDGVFSFEGIRYEVTRDCEYVDGRKKTVSSLKVLPLKGGSYSGKVTVPDVVNYHRKKLPVTKIDKEAFDNCPELTEITLPRTISSFFRISGSQRLERVNVEEGNPEYLSLDGVVYSVDRYGFPKDRGYSELCCYPFAYGEHFVVPEFVDSILPGTFEGCQMLKSVVLSDKISRIAKDTFKDCTNLESVNWGAGLKSIWGGAFENCTALKSIVFTDSIVDVDSVAFRGCKNIESITFAKGRYFDLYSLPYGLFPWGKSPFTMDGVRYRPNKDYKREGEALLIVDDLPEDQLDANVNTDVHTVSIPAKVEYYGYIYEVSECRSSFRQFPSMERLELPATVHNINIKNVDTLKEMVVDKANPEYSTIDGLLYNKEITELLAVPRGRNIKKLIIPDGVEVIAEKACSGQPYIEEVFIPDSTTTIKKSAFSSCGNLHDVHLGKGVKIIDMESFAYTAIERIVLPSTARFVNKNTWDGKSPFYGSKLKAYELDGDHELYVAIDGILYIKTSAGLRLRYCPAAYEGHLRIPEGVSDINSLACWGCTGLKSVYVPDGVDIIGDDAFAGCVNLENVEFDGHVGKIGGHCFSGCTSLKEIDCIGVKKIEDTAFRGIKGLKINLPYALEGRRSEIEKFLER